MAYGTSAPEALSVSSRPSGAGPRAPLTLRRFNAPCRPPGPGVYLHFYVDMPMNSRAGTANEDFKGT